MEEAGDDAAFIAEALGTIARARGMVQLARETGITREGLYKALSADGNPSLGTVLKVMKALGVRLAPQRLEPAAKAGKRQSSPSRASTRSADRQWDVRHR